MTQSTTPKFKLERERERHETKEREKKRKTQNFLADDKIIGNILSLKNMSLNKQQQQQKLFFGREGEEEEQEEQEERVCIFQVSGFQSVCFYLFLPSNSRVLGNCSKLVRKQESKIIKLVLGPPFQLTYNCLES